MGAEKVNFDMLISAIIKQAINDYKKHKNWRKEIEQFFLSDYYDNMCNCDGKMVIKKLRKIVRVEEKTKGSKM